MALQNRASDGRGNRAGQSPSERVRPIVDQHAAEVQRRGQIVPLPIGLDETVLQESVRMLNQVLADTLTLRDMYKKHHWQTSGATFYQLHLLFDKHFEEQQELVDELAERVQILGGVSVAMAHDIAERTKIERPPFGREEVPVQISRLLKAHELVIKETRDFAGKCEDSGDLGSNDLLVSNVLRTNEMQVWFLSEHLVSLPLVEADEDPSQPEPAEIR